MAWNTLEQGQDQNVTYHCCLDSVEYGFPESSFGLEAEQTVNSCD